MGACQWQYPISVWLHRYNFPQQLYRNADNCDLTLLGKDRSEVLSVLYKVAPSNGCACMSVHAPACLPSRSNLFPDALGQLATQSSRHALLMLLAPWAQLGATETLQNTNTNVQMRACMYLGCMNKDPHTTRLQWLLAGLALFQLLRLCRSSTSNTMYKREPSNRS